MNGPYSNTYFKGVAAKDFKDSSVKKLLLVSVYPGVPEVHMNMKKILEDLKVEAVEFLVSADIKMCKFKLLYSQYLFKDIIFTFFTFRLTLKIIFI